MRQTLFLIFLLLCLAGRVFGDTGNVAGLQSYVSTGRELRVGFYGDSWFHGSTYGGKKASADSPVARPYSWSVLRADSTACNGSEFPNYLARRLDTHHQYSNSVGSMALRTNSGGAEADSSIYGIASSADASKYNPDVVIIPGGGGFNDLFGGGTYAEIRQDAIDTADKYLTTYPNARFVVWISPRPIGLYHYLRQPADVPDTDRPLAVTEYNTAAKFKTFVSDTLRNYVSDKNRFVTFDMWDYAIGDTTGMYTLFGCSSGAEYASVQHLRWSPLSWYQDDRVHLNNYGNRCLADSVAKYLFDITLSNSYTVGAGDTVFCDLSNGDNWGNRIGCTSRQYPLATVQAAANQAHPGDVVAVIGTGNQALMAYDSTGSAWVSAQQYELRLQNPGLTIFVESGFFKGVYDATSVDIANGATTVGTSFTHPYEWSDGTAATDSLSHATLTRFRAQNPRPAMYTTFSGGAFSGYQVPISLDNTSEVTFEDTKFLGGATNAVYLYNDGVSMRNYFDTCTFYPDSSDYPASTAGLLLFAGPSTSSDSIGDTINWDGWFKKCQWIGKSSIENIHIQGPITGVDFIACTWTDPDVPITTIDYGATNLIKWGQMQPTVFANCLWTLGLDGTDNCYVQRIRSWLSDSLIFANCAANISNSTGLEHLVEFDLAANTGGGVHITHTAFNKTDQISGTDSAPPTTAPSGSTTVGCWLSPVSMSGDSVRFGGVKSFFGYDLSDWGITDTAPERASLGPTQYGYDPLLWTSGAIQGRPATATLAGPWEALKFVNAGILATSSATDPDTWFEIPRIYDESSMAVARSFLDAWEKWPSAAQAKVRFRVSGEPVTTITAADGSVYQTLGALDAAITGATETASDSLDASTWFTLPRPYNLNAAFQIEVLRAWHRTLAEANRKKIRLRVASTDFSLYRPDTTYSEGLWGALAAINAAAETASDSLDASTWFSTSRVYDMAQAQQVGVYRDAWVGWNDATRKKIRLNTK